MYERLLNLYLGGRIDEVALDAATSRMWIREEEKQAIIQSKVV